MQNVIIGVIAPKGSGKTTRVSEYIQTQPRVAIYDPMAASDFQYHAVCEETIKADLARFMVAIQEEEFSILYEPQMPVQDGDSWKYPDFAQFIGLCYLRAQKFGPMCLIVDEAHYTMAARTMPLEMWNIATNSRRWGLDIIWITQRFSGVNTWMRSNADEYWFFRLASPGDLNIVRDICGADVADDVRELRRLDTTCSPIVAGQMLKWSSLDGSIKVIE